MTFDLNDEFPPWKIDLIKEEGTRTGAIEFMSAFKDLVDSGETPPEHWLRFTAEMLGRAAEGAEMNKDKRPREIMKAMYLSGRPDYSDRNYYVARSIHYLVRRGESPKDAVIHIAADLENVLGGKVEVLTEKLKSMYYQVPHDLLDHNIDIVFSACEKHNEDVSEVTERLFGINKILKYFS